ncbi:hypothetical protein B0H14DRAFT_2590122 [Mycena olivaceomarginata]|nr:hypothetical protein B0H14DRAFT_2590122 [Mycena olivaceomarginata]
MSDHESVDLAPLTDDERASSVASSTITTAYTVLPRYSLSYPAFKPNDRAAPFEPHAFWNALSSSAGRPLAKLAVTCCHSKFEINEAVANGILNEALPAFWPWLASRISSRRTRISQRSGSFFPFPESDLIPACSLGASPPRVKAGSTGLSKDAINNAPHLSMHLPLRKEPSPVADSPPPNTGKQQSAKKHKAQPKVPKLLTTIRDESSEDEAPPPKCSRLTSTVSLALQTVRQGKGNGPQHAQRAWSPTLFDKGRAHRS